MAMMEDGRRKIPYSFKDNSEGIDIPQNIKSVHNNIYRVLIAGKVDGKREKGGPITSWMKNIVQWTGLNYPDAVRTAQDKRRWKALSSN